MRAEHGEEGRDRDNIGQCQRAHDVSREGATDDEGFEPTLVLVVRYLDGSSRRRVLFGSHAANRALQRATERGHHAEVYLAELVPVKPQNFGRVVDARTGVVA